MLTGNNISAVTCATKACYYLSMSGKSLEETSRACEEAMEFCINNKVWFCATFVLGIRLVLSKYTGRKKWFPQKFRAILFGQASESEDDPTEESVLNAMSKHSNSVATLYLEKVRYHYAMQEFSEAKENLKILESNNFLEFQALELMYPAIKILINLAWMTEKVEERLKLILDKKTPQLKDPGFKVPNLFDFQPLNFSVEKEENEVVFKKIEEFRKNSKKHLPVRAFCKLIRAERLRFDSLTISLEIISNANPLTKKGLFPHFFFLSNNICSFTL